MTDHDSLPGPDPAPEPAEHVADPVPPPERAPHHDALPWLCGLGFLLLAGAIAYVAWSNQPPRSSDALDALQARVAQLEQRPEPAARQADLGPLTARVAALEKQTAADLSPLQDRVAALEKQAGANSQAGGKLDALAARMDSLAGRDQNAASDLGHRLDADEARLTTLEHTAAQMTAKAQQAEHLARIELAQVALGNGQALGDLPDAPAAVSRFARQAPPTESGLRLAFPQAAQAALAASHPDLAGKPFLSRVLTRAEDLVTVRQGDRVLVGDPAAGVLGRARAALDAGDLQGAAAAVASLSGASAQAMAAWLADAHALLAARAGLADMAAHA
jgi:hypothetical protein